MSYERHGSFRRTYLAILGGATVIAVVGTVFAGLLSSESIAAPTVAPNNVTEPRITGTTRVGEVLRSTRGTWTGTEPIDYEYRWFRCEGRGAADASDCNRISNASNASYTLQQADAGFRIRLQVIARNNDGQDTATSNPTAVVRSNQQQPPPPPPPSSGGIPVADLKAAGDRLVVASVQFSPNPVTSRTAPITVRIRITARGGRPVNGANVFMRATPRVVSGQTAPTGGDGFVTLTLVPNQAFPQPRNGFNVQFFIKASKPGDPGLGGVAGYRLVQVRLAG